MFDDYWRFDKTRDELHTVPPLPHQAIRCRGGFVRFSPVPSVICDVDEVMSAIGFDRITGPVPVYKDRLQRKMDDRITLPFRHPPTAIHWEEIRRAVDRWFGGPDYNPANVFQFP